ncbi:MAG: DUF84 family protein [Anaerolineaceae bacterium]|jgi:non-canonical (house-cleaning) NTP pyrophosphatase
MPESLLKDEQKIFSTAKARAEMALRNKEGDYAIGFCEGIAEYNQEVFICVWCTVTDRFGATSSDCDKRIRISSYLRKKLERGELYENDIEEFLQNNYPMIYQMLIEKVLLSLTKSN